MIEKEKTVAVLYMEDFHANIQSLVENATTVDESCFEHIHFFRTFLEEGQFLAEVKDSCFDSVSLSADSKKMLAAELPSLVQNIFSLFTRYKNEKIGKDEKTVPESYGLFLENVANVLRPSLTKIAEQNPALAALLPQNISDSDMVRLFETILTKAGYMWYTNLFGGDVFPHVEKITQEKEKNIDFMGKVYAQMTGRADIFQIKNFTSKIIHHKVDESIFPEQFTFVAGHVLSPQPGIVFVRDIESRRTDIPGNIFDEVVETHEVAHSYFNRVVPSKILNASRGTNGPESLSVELSSIDELFATCASVHEKSIEHMLIVLCFIKPISDTYKHISHYILDPYMDEFEKRLRTIPTKKPYSREEIVDFLKHGDFSEVVAIHQRLFTEEETRLIFSNAAKEGMKKLEKVLSIASVDRQIQQKEKELFAKGVGSVQIKETRGQGEK